MISRSYLILCGSSRACRIHPNSKLLSEITKELVIKADTVFVYVSVFTSDFAVLFVVFVNNHF